MHSLLAATDWGPVGVWAGATATAAAALIALLAGTGRLDRRRPRLHATFKPDQPWTRTVHHDTEEITWLRVSIANTGRQPARGCIGRLTAVTSSGTRRTDVDPIQLRWAGMPRSRSFQPIDIRPGQREYLNVVYRTAYTGPWHLDTFPDLDFDPGFPIALDPDTHHHLTIGITADNAATDLTIELLPRTQP